MQPDKPDSTDTQNDPPNPIEQVVLPPIETYAVPPKKPKQKMMLVVLVIIIAAAAAGYFLLRKS